MSKKCWGLLLLAVAVFLYAQPVSAFIFCYRASVTSGDEYSGYTTSTETYCEYIPDPPGYCYACHQLPGGGPTIGPITPRVCPPAGGWALGLSCYVQACDYGSCGTCCNTLYPCRFNCDSAAVEAGLISYDEWAMHTACEVGAGLTLGCNAFPA